MRMSTTGRVGASARLVAWGFGILVGLCGARAFAVDPTCFPVGGGGVPGQPGAPDWTTGTSPYDDPRWIGSYGFGQGTVTFNSLVEGSGSTKTLLLRWHVTGDAGAALAGDQIWVGFYDPTGTGSGTILQLTRDALVSTDGGASVGTGTMSVSAFTRSGGAAFWSSATVPAGISTGARLDAFCDTSGAPVVCDEWIIRLRVPMTAAAGGIDLPDPFGMWYEVDVEHGNTGTTDEAKWPTGVINVDQTTAPVTFPDPVGTPPWFSVTGAGGICAAGIDIQSDNISVVNSTDGAGTQIALTGVNTFHARPTNNTTTIYSPNAIKARLRIADWGSFVGDSPRWDTVPDPSCAAATGPTTGTVAGGAPFDLTCTWTLTAGQQCDYGHATGCTPDALGTRDSHQCIIADLSSTAVAVPFSTSSAWNNFNFDHSSKLERQARIDIGTLSPRDVYVYIATNNLPEKVEETPPPNTQQTPGRALSGAAKERMGALAALTPGRVTEKDAATLRSLVAAGRLSYADVAKVMPTYTAYVWHDSGTTVKTKNGTAKLLVPQPSFTLFVSHDGPLVGWKHAFAGVGGAVVTELAHNYYRIGVGSTGSVQVSTSIEALEHLPRTGLPLWLILLGMLLLLILIWIIIRVIRG